MRATRVIFIVLALPVLSGCTASRVRSPQIDAALLRLEYRECAPRLPAMRLDGVQLQESSRLGRTSSVVWHFQEKKLGREFFLPFPDSDKTQEQMHESLSSTLEAFGFSLRGWPGDPQVLVGVNVKRLHLNSLGLEEGYRSCELELEFVLREASGGLEIKRFIAKGKSRFKGSWTSEFRTGPRWLPTSGEPNPVLEATREAALDFLDQSHEFWNDPSQWEPTLRFSAAGR